MKSRAFILWLLLSTAVHGAFLTLAETRDIDVQHNPGMEVELVYGAMAPAAPAPQHPSPTPPKAQSQPAAPPTQSVGTAKPTPPIPTRKPVASPTVAKPTAAPPPPVEAAAPPEAVVDQDRVPAPAATTDTAVAITTTSLTNDAASSTAAPTAMAPGPSTPASVPTPAPQGARDLRQMLRCLHSPEPVYPTYARKRRLQGEVMLRLKICETGNVVEATVEGSSGHSILDDSALAAVRQWKFAPPYDGRQYLSVEVLQAVQFKLKKS